MAGIDVAGHRSELARFAIAGAGPGSAAGAGDPARLTDRRRGIRRWSVIAFGASLLAHGAVIALLLQPIRSQPLSASGEQSFQLVFAPPTKLAPNAVDPPVQQPLTPPVAVQEVSPPVDAPAATAEPPPAPMLEPQQAPTPSPTPASESPVAEPPAPAVAPAPPIVAPKASTVARHAGMRAAPPHHAVEAPRASAPQPNATAPPPAAAPFVPPSPIAGIETNRAPVYPPSALRRGEQGNVMLRVSVSADGAPLAVDMAVTSGYPSLDRAAEAAVRQWRFNPARRDGIAVAAIADVPVRFRLSN